jgi:hypothetical protein
MKMHGEFFLFVSCLIFVVAELLFCRGGNFSVFVLSLSTKNSVVRDRRAYFEIESMRMSFVLKFWARRCGQNKVVTGFSNRQRTARKKIIAKFLRNLFLFLQA